MKIQELSKSQFEKYFIEKIYPKIKEDPIRNFIRAPGFVDLEPMPGQSVLLKIVFGQELDDKEYFTLHVEDTSADEFKLIPKDFTEVTLYEELTGFPYDPDLATGGVINFINLLCGRRSGKSTISAALALYSVLKENWRPFLKKTPVATVAILSHTREFSEEILDIIRTMVEESPILSRLKDNSRKDTQSTFHLKIPFYKEGTKRVVYSYVAIKVGAASKKTTRGRAICTLLADEACWWNLDENSKESDVDVFRAIRPALKQFGKHALVMKLSSPAIKTGVMYEEWTKREKLKSRYIQLKAPSWMMNSFIPIEEYYNEYEDDPDGFDTEWRANFVDSISNFIVSDYVQSCVMPKTTFIPPDPEAKSKTTYRAAIDAAFKSDKFAFTIVGQTENRVTVHCLKAWQGSKKSPVQAKEVAKFIRKACGMFGLGEVLADQYAFQPLKEIFQEFGITLIENTFSIVHKRKIYFGLKRLIHNQQIDLPDIPLLHKEIKELQVEQTPTGQIRIGHPSGGSDDLADAVAIASYYSMETHGQGQFASAELAGGSHPDVPTDIHGRAFTGPAPTMLAQYKGFGDVIDNSKEWMIHPDTKKWVRVREYEDENALGEVSEQGNFTFS